jgi:hypothetical protein
MLACGAGAGGGGGGGGGVTTVTVADAVCVPPGPVAVSVYVAESFGDTRELPAACTVPTPWLMETLETWPVTSQRNTADSPFWIELGSALNCAILGAAGGGGAGASTGAGGGGGGGGATFFLQPSAISNIEAAKQMIETFRLLNMYIASW